MTAIDAAAAPQGAVWGRRRGRPPVLIGACLAFLALVVFCAITGTMLAPDDPSAQDLAAGLQPAGGAHLLGTDDSGRDVLSRVIAGCRAAVVGPVLIAAGAALVGTVLGLAAGYLGGWFDTVIMRSVDVVYALPPLLVAIVLLGVIGGGYWTAVATLVALFAPVDSRVVRGATLDQRSRPYVDAARTLGLPARVVMARHVLPNIVPLLAANACLAFAYGLLALAALSFLGLGVGPGQADWGRMLSENMLLLADNPLAPLAPALLIVLTATSMNLVGDWLTELLSDRGRAR